MGPLLKYTLLRFALFFAVLAVLWIAGARSWLLLLLAAVASFALSYVVLRGPREEVAARLAARSSNRLEQRRTESDEQAEDAALDSDDRRPPTTS